MAVTHAYVLMVGLMTIVAETSTTALMQRVLMGQLASIMLEALIAAVLLERQDFCVI